MIIKAYYLNERLNFLLKYKEFSKNVGSNCQSESSIKIILVSKEYFIRSDGSD